MQANHSQAKRSGPENVELSDPFTHLARARCSIAAAVAIPVVALARLVRDTADQSTRNTTNGGANSCTAHVIGDCASDDGAGCCTDASPAFGCGTTCKG